MTILEDIAAAADSLAEAVGEDGKSNPANIRRKVTQFSQVLYSKEYSNWRNALRRSFAIMPKDSDPSMKNAHSNHFDGFLGFIAEYDSLRMQRRMNSPEFFVATAMVAEAARNYLQIDATQFIDSCFRSGNANLG